jgi:ATP-dependent DNA ligase
VAQVPPGTVLDGEVVVWNGSRLDFGLLQQRMVAAPAGSAPSWPPRRPPTSPSTCSRWAARTCAAAGCGSGGPRWRSSPPGGRRPCSSPRSPADPAEARQWSTDFRPAGVEGLVAKGAGTRYAPGRREWLKVKSWETTEVLAGGVIGSLERPGQLVAGRYRDGELVVVGRTSPLSPAHSAELAAVLRPAGPDHPWPDRIGTGAFGGGRLSVPLTRVQPDVVVEVSADAALQAGVFRHPLRFVRVRPDLAPGDVPGTA